MDTYRALRELEMKRWNGGNLSIDQLVRFDVSVIQNPNNGFDYFVNEVERGMLVCLYPCASPARARRIIDEWGLTMMIWLNSHYKVSAVEGE